MKVAPAVLFLLTTVAVTSGQDVKFEEEDQGDVTISKKAKPNYPQAVDVHIGKDPRLANQMQRYQRRFRAPVQVKKNNECKVICRYIYKWRKCWIFGPRIPVVTCKKNRRCRGKKECVPTKFQRYNVPVFCNTKCCGWRLKWIRISVPRACQCQNC